MRSTIQLVAIAILSSAAVAQSNIPRLGPFSAAGVGFAKKGLGNDLFHRRPEPVAPGPFLPTALGGILFRQHSIFAQIDAELRDDIEIDAISSGNDFVPVSMPSGRLTPSLGLRAAWTTLFFSLTDGPTPATGSPMHAMKSLGGVGGDVFSWVALGSGEVLGTFGDQVNLEVPAETLGMPRSSHLTAMDLPMALLVQNGGTPDNVFVSRVGVVYFSVTAQSAGILRSELQNPLISGATILSTQWIGPGWGPITVFKTASELGLEGPKANDPVDDEELDALAVDSQSHSEAQIIFSTELTIPNDPQLWVMLGSVGPVELLDENGASLRTRFGGTSTDIDAVCGIDPERDRHSELLSTPIASGKPKYYISVASALPPNVTSGNRNLVIDVNGDNGTDLMVGVIALQMRPYSTGAWQTLPGFPKAWHGRGTARFVRPAPPTQWITTQFRAIYGGQSTVWITNLGTLRM